MDTVIGKAKGKNPVLLVLTERLTRYEIIIKIRYKKTKYVVNALNKLQKKYGHRFKEIFKTITVDNSCEFADMEEMQKGDRTTIYYCHPYSSWEHGSNENCNAIIRRFIPKGINIQSVSAHQVAIIQDWINNYPRHVIGTTAQILFSKYIQQIA